MRPNFRRARLALGCAMALAFALLLLRSAPASAAEPTAMKVGISEAVNTVLAIWMAEAAGLYEAQNIKVEIINMR